MLQQLSKSNFVRYLVVLYLMILVWWISLQTRHTPQPEVFLFNWAYGLINISSAIYAVKLAYEKWGGTKSIIGRGLIFLGLGLIGQWLGLQVWTYFNLIAKVELPYPSIADFGYFALVPTYTIASLLFARASGASFSLRTKNGKLVALLIPGVFLAVASFMFLKNVGADLSQPVKTFFDFGYPLGEIIPVSVALFTLSLSGSILGGTMRKRIIVLVCAFVLQFIAEYTFLYTVGIETFVNGGLNDILYASSYTLMGLAIANFSYYD